MATRRAAPPRSARSEGVSLAYTGRRVARRPDPSDPRSPSGGMRDVPRVHETRLARWQGTQHGPGDPPITTLSVSVSHFHPARVRSNPMPTPRSPPRARVAAGCQRDEHRGPSTFILWVCVGRGLARQTGIHVHDTRNGEERQKNRGELTVVGGGGRCAGWNGTRCQQGRSRLDWQ